MKCIVACDIHGGIGYKNSLPWRCPDDLKHFKETTLNKTILMSRKTALSIGKPLPHRKTIILTRNPTSDLETSSVDLYVDDDDVYLCGGAEIYREFIDYCSEAVVTHLNISVSADAFFELACLSRFKNRELLKIGKSNDIEYTIVRYY